MNQQIYYYRFIALPEEIKQLRADCKQFFDYGYSKLKVLTDSVNDV